MRNSSTSIESEGDPVRRLGFWRDNMHYFQVYTMLILWPNKIPFLRRNIDCSFSRGLLCNWIKTTTATVTITIIQVLKRSFLSVLKYKKDNELVKLILSIRFGNAFVQTILFIIFNDDIVRFRMRWCISIFCTGRP